MIRLQINGRGIEVGDSMEKARERIAFGSSALVVNFDDCCCGPRVGRDEACCHWFAVREAAV